MDPNFDGHGPSEDHDDEEEGLKRFLPFLVFAALLLVIGGGLFYFIKSMSGGGPPPPPKEQMISVVVPPPPPPPPPEIEPPPPEEEVPEIEEPEPEPEPEAIDEADSDEPPPAEGSDVETGIEGGGGMKIGGGGRRGGGGDPRRYWAGQISRDLERVLASSEKYRSRGYNLQVLIWFEQNGRLRDLEVKKGSGDAIFDEQLRDFLLSSYRRADAPPESMQPVLLRIRADQ